MLAKRQRSLLRQIGALFLIGSYLFVFMLSKISHELSHEHEEEHVVHTVEAEQDECHRTLYHAAQNNGCDHREHFLPSSSSCELCDAFIRNYQIDDEASFIAAAEFLLELEETKLPLSISPVFVYQRSPRAPPIS